MLGGSDETRPANPVSLPATSRTILPAGPERRDGRTLRPTEETIMGASTRVAIIGAGNVGGGLGVRLSNSGLPVKFGVRPGTDVKALLASCKDATATAPEEAAAWGELVFLAVPGAVALEVARSLAGALAGKVVVDCNNPLVWKDGPVWTPPPEGSLAAAIAKAAPGARVVKGFNTFGAEFHKDPSRAGVPADVFLAGDDAGAKKLVMDLAKQAGFRPVDAGPLRNAAVLENVAMLWIHLATVGGQGRDFTFVMQRKG
jgi:8-hydroxy-5-deazaflavin:NADPH oxidoreductase